MTYNFISNSELDGLSASDKFYLYAQAFLDSAILLNRKMLEEPSELYWGKSAVVLHLSAHAMELFLKCAIIKSSSDIDLSLIHI